MSAIGTIEGQAGTAPPMQDEALYEVVDGQKVELLPTGIYASAVSLVLARLLAAHASKHGLGNVPNLAAAGCCPVCGCLSARFSNPMLRRPGRLRAIPLDQENKVRVSKVRR
jgi:hypothetical protein